jgi:anti-sigma B factor antagonist
LTLGDHTAGFQKYFDRKIADGFRFFILDFSDIQYLDSSGVATIVALITRVKMRTGRTLFINTKTVEPVFQLTKLVTILDIAPDLASALESIAGKPVKVPTDLKYEDRFSITLEGKEGARKLVVNDRMSEPGESPQSAEYTVRDIPPPSPERLSITGMAGVAFVALTILALLVFGLVWVTKQVSSVPLLVLIFCVALLFSLTLLALVLLLSGHLSEKMVGKLLTGMLGKIPGLGIWVPKVLAKKGKN